MTPRISLALVIHNHQPVGNFGWVIDEVHRTAYEPMIGALERHPGLRVGLHYSGPLLEWLLAERPDTVARVQSLVTRGQVEILGGAWSEPILASLPEHDRLPQLVRMGDEIERLFGGRPRGAWLAERVWEPSLPADLARGGYDWTILDDNHLRAASVPEDEMWSAYSTDDQGWRLTVFGTEQGLRYRIPFGPVEDVIAYLHDHATEDGRRLGMMGDDGEKFGSWPTTYEHCWGSGAWVERCFAALEANADWLATTTPSGWLEREPPSVRIYVPTSSYVEMTEWALPASEGEAFHVALAAARASGAPEARFLRGGFWRNFQARYREIGDLHKQMLRISAKVRAMPEGPARARAVDHLQRGQSNDCYWHGLFGGIYIVHMRMAALAQLIAAEDLADTASRSASAAGPAERAELTDWDLDGQPEVLLSSPAQVISVDLAEGAGIGAWDLRASRVALLAVMRRRPEAYHARLLAAEAAVAETHPAGEGGTTSIHERLSAKQAGLGAALHYDDHERRSGLVRLLESGASLETLRRAEEMDLVPVAVPWRATRVVPGDLLVEREHGSLSLARRLRYGGARARPWLELDATVTNHGAERVAADLALEWGICLSGGGGNPAAWYETPAGEGAERSPHDGAGDHQSLAWLDCGNDHEGVRVHIAPTPAARTTWFAIETVSNSEAGFERVYQGSALLFRWPIALAPGASAHVALRLEVSQTRDRAVEEVAPA
ncbi:MAG: alpha-amylase/4-alpha-glucanotransferase domain-containing protein [Candidatus Limnocylindrales bacterium]